MDNVILVLCNVPDEAAGQAIANAVVEQGLAACVNLLPVVQSVYRWQGKIERATETTLLIKSSAGRYPELEQAIRARHPYDVPEILCLPVQAGLPAYLQWVLDETRKPIDA
jgi:periplasmic divalent cation tolerance protein